MTKWIVFKNGVKENEITSETLSYDFLENTSQSDITYTINVEDNDGCTATTTMVVPSGDACKSCEYSALTISKNDALPLPFYVTVDKIDSITGTSSVILNGYSKDCNGDYIEPTFDIPDGWIIDRFKGDTSNGSYELRLKYDGPYTDERFTATVHNSYGAKDSMSFHFYALAPCVTLSDVTHSIVGDGSELNKNIIVTCIAKLRYDISGGQNLIGCQTSKYQPMKTSVAVTFTVDYGENACGFHESGFDTVEFPVGTTTAFPRAIITVGNRFTKVCDVTASSPQSCFTELTPGPILPNM